MNHFTRHAPGTKENPLDTDAVNAKARGLMEPVLGAKKTEAVIQRVNALEGLANVRELGRFSPRARPPGVAACGRSVVKASGPFIRGRSQ